MLSTAHKFVFVHVPKTGGNSIQRVLLPFSDDKMVLLHPHHDGIDRFEIQSDKLSIHKHSTLDDYHRQLSPADFSGLFKFSCVRNPWDRCVSFFFSPHRGAVEWSPAAFEDFIERAVAPHAAYLQLEGQSGDPFDNLDAVLIFERLADDFDWVCERLGLGRHPLPIANASHCEHYRAYYTCDRSIDLVARKFSLEIERFGYAF